MHNTLFVFDIETVPNTDLCSVLTGCTSNKLNEQRKAMSEYHLEITDGKNSFLRQPFHKVVAISILIANIETEDGYEKITINRLVSLGIDKNSEKEIIEKFFQYLCKEKPRLVSFNGRTFDLPVLKYRAMEYDIQAKEFYRSGDKWNNYSQRYSSNWHCDLLDTFSDYGASARVKMNEAAIGLKIPGKLDTSGEDVTKLFDEKKFKEIKDYCETDVITTYLLYLKSMHHQGFIKTNNYNREIINLKKFLTQKSNSNQKFTTFLAIMA